MQGDLWLSWISSVDMLSVKIKIIIKNKLFNNNCFRFINKINKFNNN